MNVENAVRLADALNAQLAPDAAFFAGVWSETKEKSIAVGLAVVSNAFRSIIEVIQSDDARTLYYTTRHYLRGANRFCQNRLFEPKKKVSR